MSNVNKFDLEGTIINVEDSTARADASTANANVVLLGERVGRLENLSRITVAYIESTSTISFSNTTH